jgi:hypothetical protein
MNSKAGPFPLAGNLRHTIDCIQLGRPRRLRRSGPRVKFKVTTFECVYIRHRTSFQVNGIPTYHHHLFMTDTEPNHMRSSVVGRGDFLLNFNVQCRQVLVSSMVQCCASTGATTPNIE